MTTENKVFAANDPHLHITPDFDNGVARFAAAAIATHLYNLGRWNGVDTLVFQSDPIALNVLPIDLLTEGDEYTIEGVQTSLGAHGDLYDLLDDEPVSQETQQVTVPNLFGLPGQSQIGTGWDTDGDPAPGDKIHPDPLPEGVDIEPGFAMHSADVPLDAGDPSTRTLPPVTPSAEPDFLADFDDLTRSDFTPSAAAGPKLRLGEQSRSDSSAVFEAALAEVRHQLAELAEQLADALTVNRLQSDMLREIATPRKTRIEVCTLVQNIDRYRAQADEALALCRNEGWQAVSYGYLQEPDGYHFRVVTLERTVPADLPEPDFKASHNGVGHMIVDAQPVPVGMAVPLSNGFGHVLEAW